MDTATPEQVKKFLDMFNYTPKSIHDKPTNAYEEFVLEGYRKGYRKGYEIGIKLGSGEMTNNIAIKAYKSGVGIEIISASLELSEAEVRKILSDAGLIE